MKKIIVFFLALCLSATVFGRVPRDAVGVYRGGTPVGLEDRNGGVAVRGTVPPNGNYYYTYHNNVCFNTQYADVTPVGTYVVNGNSIYCYAP